MRVLLLEDDDHLRYTFRAALLQQDHAVTASANIAEAEDALLNQRPDVAILDLMVGNETSLPVADLTAVVSPNTEIIFVTGSGLFPHAELFHLQASVAAVLRKPVDIQHLIEIVSHIYRHPKPRMSHSDLRNAAGMAYS